MKKQSPQEELWTGDFGLAYTNRNPQCAKEFDELYKVEYGKTATEIYTDFFTDTNIAPSRQPRILEVGCNVGCQLEIFQQLGFANLYGLDIQWDAIEKAQRRLRHINFTHGNALDIPFRDEFFDLVFTAGLLIHISPTDIHQAVGELRRCSRQYIWGFECWSKEYTEVENWHGQSNMFWKTDFPRYFGWPVLKEQIVPYPNKEYVDILYLLEKPKARMQYTVGGLE